MMTVILALVAIISTFVALASGLGFGVIAAEAYLPFALALGVEQQWSERFTRIFAALKGPNNSGWSPVWYNGSWNNFDPGSNGPGLSSSLSSAISSSATLPGSSSGSGGGGGW